MKYFFPLNTKKPKKDGSKKKKWHEELMKQKQIESTAKEILGRLNEASYKVNDIRTLLKCKLGSDQYGALKVSKMSSKI
jgi:hypothetical protein